MRHGAAQEHAAVMQSVDARRNARHERLSSMGYAHLVDGINSITVSSRRQGQDGASAARTSAPGMAPSTSNSSNDATHHRQARPPQRGRGGFGSHRGRGGSHQGGGASMTKGKGKEHPVTPAGDFVAANENAEEEKRKKALKELAYGSVYNAQEESLRNDLSQNYINTGHRPQNMIQGAALEKRFREYPKLEKLLHLHTELVRQHACPPTYLTADLQKFHLAELLPVKFDSILIDPPLEEYARDYPTRVSGDHPYWTWDELAALPIPQIASNPGFIWLWVGSGKCDRNGVSGLDKGRELLAKWGYRRCEDIVWLKTNRQNPSLADEPPTQTVFTHTKEHCLMGIRGTVRRSTDGHFVHCNVDTDVIVWEGDDSDPLKKPPELYNLIENFCLGTRRLELFGRRHNGRAGWLTVGDDALSDGLRVKPAGVAENSAVSSEALKIVEYDKQNFDSYFTREAQEELGNLVPTTAEVDNLRPRSPDGPNKSSAVFVPGMKSNPQGIGRHTNRAATPSASQALEFERLQAQFQEQVMRQQQQQQLELERRRQEEMLQQQQFMMQQMAMMNGGMNMGMGMGMGMNMNMNMGMPTGSYMPDAMPQYMFGQQQQPQQMWQMGGNMSPQNAMQGQYQSDYNQQQQGSMHQGQYGNQGNFFGQQFFQ